MQKLNLPEFDVEAVNETVKCMIRRKWVKLTPEEWVRQHFLNLLVLHLHYPKGRIKLEMGMTYFQNQKRSDIVVLNEEGAPLLLIECKTFQQKLNQSTVDQVFTYNKVLNSQLVAVTNGMQHFIWELKDGHYEPLSNFPEYKNQ